MARDYWVFSVRVPLPAGASAQAKILVKVGGPVEVFCKALPGDHEVLSDRVMRGREVPPAPSADQDKVTTLRPENDAAE